MRLLLSLIYILLFNITVSYSQVSFYFTEYPKKDSVLKVIEDIHRNQLKLSVDSESLKEVYKWRLKYTKCLFDTNAIVFEPQIYEYVGSIFDEIISSNSELKTLQLRYFVSNSPIPNSYSLGDGTVIINIGLIRKLKNEAQLAFVCCHEISHYLLNHSK